MTRTPDRWQSPDGSIEILRGESLDLLRSLDDESFDSVVTDPPYSSGGFTRSDRSDDPVNKYEHTGTEIVRASFSGDNRDGRAWCYWSALWISEAFRLVRQNGYALTFTDWRQLPLATDALQAGGFVWRGLVAWDKTEGSRAPHTGYFRHQCEYVAWGTKGVSKAAEHGGPWPGCFRVAVKQSDKHHLTGKPTELMERLLEHVPPGGRVLDPIAGSGTTLVASIRRGLRATGIEQSREYFQVAVDRCKRELSRHPLLPAEVGRDE